MCVTRRPAETVSSGSLLSRSEPTEYTKKNSKAEYPLNVALQTPNRRSEVINMIERGHPLEEEDNAGWTPLHWVRLLVTRILNISRFW